MISDQVSIQLESLGLVLERIQFSSLSANVSVGVADRTGRRWIGTAPRTPHDPNAGLLEAYERSLGQFNPDWRKSP
ncbi:MAG: hypothetical protein A3C06_02585 [Candidatus Taylorbacteria bacterium RIFCSPHIGHO2_02_FULL_46_13]|uniref:Uncharacterized protein n=1 Tax=Candidatus Taylorbacteria bacterium RIFCSPHIGHO2_02_FULL_46_13 TaxID=1802312 RepID=A0A1G2MTQ8_9BACT|nr:MAG: hypothetical protein A3C06_02585 [Candidatus Taylorbacteria bacterium RIFCSPHIGHO2_02_FULL_46_13]